MQGPRERSDRPDHRLRRTDLEIRSCDPPSRHCLVPDDAHILGERPEGGIYEARWTELAERAGDRPIWMLNFLAFAERVVYGDDAQDVAPPQRRSPSPAHMNGTGAE